MADTKTVVVPGLKDIIPPQGSQVSLLVKGTDTYEELRVGRELVIQNEDKTKQVTAVISNLRVGALIEMLAEYGQSNILNYGRPYTQLSAIQSMSDAEGADVVDVTRLYTGIMFVTSGPATDVAPVTGSTQA